jgi:hypothetical protein
MSIRRRPTLSDSLDSSTSHVANQHYLIVNRIASGLCACSSFARSCTASRNGYERAPENEAHARTSSRTAIRPQHQLCSGAGGIDSLRSLGMRTLTLGLLISSLVSTACQGDSSDRDDEQPATASAVSRLIPQVIPPLDIKAAPDDAAKTASGLAYKKLTARNTDAPPRCWCITPAGASAPARRSSRPSMPVSR